MKSRDDKRKISVRMWEPLLLRFNQLCAAACLNRDAYFDIVLGNEAPMLTAELEGKRNSEQARRYIRRCLLDLRELRPASFSVRQSTANAVDRACEEVNIWRDVFINRVAYLLVARTTSLEQQWDVQFDNHREEIFEDGWEIKRLLLGPRLFAVESFVKDDPFAGLRAVLRVAPFTERALHLQPLGKPGATEQDSRGLLGFCTYLEDSSVPGTEANAEQQRMLAELLESLDLAPGEPPVAQHGSSSPSRKRPAAARTANRRAQR